MFAFQLYETTLDLAQALNNGVRPPLEHGRIMYFVYKGKDEAPMIMDNIEFKELFVTESVKDILLYKVKDF